MVKENPWHDNYLLLQARLEEIQPISYSDTLQMTQIQPDIERASWHVVAREAHRSEPTNDVVTLVQEMMLQGFHLGVDEGRLKHLDSGLLEGDVRAVVVIRAVASEGGDECFGPKEPADAPAGEAKAFREAVDDDDVYKGLGQGLGYALELDFAV